MAKERYTLEFDMKSIPAMLLWPYISTPSGLSQWFADDVKRDERKFTFYWNGYPTVATQIGARTGICIKFRWDDDLDKNYFEMKILVSELTDNTLLSITDFADPEEIGDDKDVWINQVDTLKRMLGC